jgi:hypothetical protein
MTCTNSSTNSTLSPHYLLTNISSITQKHMAITGEVKATMLEENILHTPRLQINTIPLIPLITYHTFDQGCGLL